MDKQTGFPRFIELLKRYGVTSLILIVLLLPQFGYASFQQSFSASHNVIVSSPHTSDDPGGGGPWDQWRGSW